MAFSLFTKRSEYTSKRLRFVARGLQIFGVIAGITTAIGAISLANSTMMEWPPSLRDAFLRRSGFWAVGQLVSYLFIGHALLRRQRTGAYMAVATIGLPLLYPLLWAHKVSYTPWFFNVLTIGLPVLTLALITSVWRELGSVRDSEMIDHRPEPDAPIAMTPRNRGYREQRILPLEKMPTATTAVASAPLPISNPRAH
ncbi:MAG: hypothetical protein ABJB74_10580 [Gemmatimonas sp.]